MEAEETSMSYRAPIADILFAMTHEAGLDLGLKDGTYADLGDGFAEATLTEAGKFAENVLAPLNRVGDKEGAKFEADMVTAAPGFAEAYRQWTAGGWNAITGPSEYGGMGLPVLLNTACIEIWSAANMAFSLCPLLTLAAIEAVQSHVSEALKAVYLAKLVSGEWSGTMNLTEPQAGSDLGALKTRAERRQDGTYKLFGSKIFITYGEHDMTENIVHFVLARLPDAPKGTRGISLFLVPKFFVDADGAVGPRNDVHCISLEHKLGIHASPTCTMVYGDHGGATGFLVGEENKGLACMFTMMNSGRLNVGVQGVAIAERAFQQALAYAKERRQGHVPGDLSHDGGFDRSFAPGKGPGRAGAGRGACLVADAGREGLFHRHRQRGRLARNPDPWRHGLHRRDRRSAISPRREDRGDLRRHQWRSGNRFGAA
jgi:acyl-CoA dehydrogenase